MGKAEWGVTPVCWWLGLYFCFVCCLDEASCTVCYWWVSDARSCVQVVSFVWVLSIWYSLGLVLWYPRVLESVLPLLSLRAWSLFRNEDSTHGVLWHQVILKQITKMRNQRWNRVKWQLPNQTIIIIMECTYVHMHQYASQNNKTKIKYSRLTWWTKEIKNYIYKLRTKLTKAQTRKQY